MDGEFMETPSISNVGRSVSQLRFPCGFRFRPTDLELIREYLMRKVKSESFEVHVIAEVDLSKFHPEQLPGVALLKGEDEWFFFTQLQMKYPKGTRPNRAAAQGYWKATGTDKKIIEANHIGHPMLVGWKKTLVFYEGKAPRGIKTNWIMHEYRLPGCRAARAAHNHHRGSIPPMDWVLCRIKKKQSSLAQRTVSGEVDLESMFELDEQITADSPTQEQGVVDSATTSTFAEMMHSISGAMSSTVPGLLVSSSSWTPQHIMTSSSQLATELAVQTGLQTGPPQNYLLMQQFHQGPRSSASFTAPVYNNPCIGADAGQRSSFSDDLEVQSQFENSPDYGEGTLYWGL